MTLDGARVIDVRSRPDPSFSFTFPACSEASVHLRSTGPLAGVGRPEPGAARLTFALSFTALACGPIDRQPAPEAGDAVERLDLVCPARETGRADALDQLAERVAEDGPVRDRDLGERVDHLGRGHPRNAAVHVDHPKGPGRVVRRQTGRYRLNGETGQGFFVHGTSGDDELFDLAGGAPRQALRVAHPPEPQSTLERLHDELHRPGVRRLRSEE